MSSDSPDVWFVGYRVGLDMTFGSEFLKPVELLNARGTRAEVLVLSALGEFIRPDLRALWSKRLSSVPGTARDHVARFPVMPSRLSPHVDESWLLALALWKSSQRRTNLIVHAVGSRAGNLAIRARRFLPGRQIRVLFRSIGPSAEEFLYRVGGPAGLSNQVFLRRYKRLQTDEETAYRSADAVVTLSESMRHHAIAQRRGADRVFNIGCLADVSMFSDAVTERVRTRRELGWEGKLVVVHSGTLHPWQRPVEVVRLFELIHEIEPRSRLVMLTHDARVIEAALSASSLPEKCCTLVSVEFTEVPRYLAAADIGLIGRGLMEAPSIVNAFSSPIKFSEYLATGCPVLMGEGVGDFSSVAKSHDLGLVLPHDISGSALRESIEAFLRRYVREEGNWRHRCEVFAKHNLDMCDSVETYQAIYRTLSAEMAP